MPFRGWLPAGNPGLRSSEDRQPSDGHQSSEMRDESAATVSRGAGAGGSGGSVVRTVCIRGFPSVLSRERATSRSFFAGYEALARASEWLCAVREPGGGERRGKDAERPRL